MNICVKLNNYKLLALCAILTSLIAGCAGLPDDSEGHSDEYFDIPGYFTGLADDLNESRTGLRKTLTRPADSEVVNKNDVDWMAELKPFIDIDLNKPAFSGGYLADTSIINDTMTIIYTARDSTFDIKEVTLSFQGNILTKLEALHSKDNVYYYSSEVLTFEHRIGYYISVSNVMKAGKPVEFSIRGEMTGGMLN